jgi:hypothetical protein
MRGHRLAGPDRADFIRGVVADGEHEIQLRRIRLGELVPGFAAQSFRRQMILFQQLDGQRDVTSPEG